MCAVRATHCARLSLSQFSSHARLTSPLKPSLEIFCHPLSQAGAKKIPAGESSLRRQIAAGESLPAGSGRAWRLDPRSLPVRFAAEDRAADGRTRLVELDRDRVLLTRTVSGVLMRLNLPLSNFLGIAMRLLPASGESPDTIAIVLEHRDAALSIPLHVACETDHLIADWQLWASVLRKKLLVAELDGSFREPFATLGVLPVSEMIPRRLRRTALRARRPKMFRRRVVSRAMADMPSHIGEREIIARD
jgi:hypothetical protein